MAKRDEIIKFLNNYLEIDKWQDDYHNGLEVKGAGEVKKIAVGVTPSLGLFQKAKKAGAQMVITHHYLHLKKDPKHPVPIPNYELERVRFLKKNKISFANYHLPLDFHNEIGNEILTLKQFGFDIVSSKFYFQKGFYGGKLKKSTTLQAIIKKGNKIYPDKPIVLKFGPKKISSIAVITGSAHSFYEEARKAGARTFITGNLKVESPDVARELGLNIIAYGHHNTEKVGIEALGKLVAEKFNIKQEFINIQTSI